MGWVGIDKDYPVSIKEVLDITAETGALTAQSRIRELKPYKRLTENENQILTICAIYAQNGYNAYEAMQMITSILMEDV